VAGALTFGQTNPGQAGAGQAGKGGPQAPHKKRVLAIGAVEGYQHDSVSNGLATIWKLGHDSGLWDTYIKTDTQLLTKQKLTNNARNIDYFDAIFLYTTGELPMTDEQKAALLAFVHDDGKGVVGGHSAIDTWYKWPAYGDMMGAYFDNHPWGQFDAPIIIEDRHFPGMDLFAPSFVMKDEIYQPSEIFSREKVRVLARLDETKLDLNHKGVKRTDKDFAVAWVKNYGKGRVFYSTFGHREEVWDRPDVQNMYREAIKWALGLVPGDATPRPRP
jgi:type 1 glutamine amidotransferase